MYTGTPPSKNASRVSRDSPAYSYPYYSTLYSNSNIRVPYSQAFWGSRWDTLLYPAMRVMGSKRTVVQYCSTLPVIQQSSSIPACWLEPLRGAISAHSPPLFTCRYLGNMQISYDAAGAVTNISGNPILLGGTGSESPVPSDPTLEALAAELFVPVAKLAAQIVGSTLVPLVRGSPGDSNLGNLICVSLSHSALVPTAL